MTVATQPRAAAQFLPLALGQIVATPGALDAIERQHRHHAPDYARRILARHARGDWGYVDDEDKDTNDRAVIDGARILSAYPIDPAQPCKGHGANCLWIITEADRSSTTILLPSEY